MTLCRQDGFYFPSSPEVFLSLADVMFVRVPELVAIRPVVHGVFGP